MTTGLSIPRVVDTEDLTEFVAVAVNAMIRTCVG